MAMSTHTAVQGKKSRAVCEFCDRPAKVCLCEWLPHTGEEFVNPPLRVVLLQHPQERKQKHQSDFFLLRCLRDVHIFVGRKMESVLANPISNRSTIELNTKAASYKFSDEIFAQKIRIGKKPEEVVTPDLSLSLNRTLVLYPSDAAVEIDSLFLNKSIDPACPPEIDEPKTDHEKNASSKGVKSYVQEEAEQIRDQSHLRPRDYDTLIAIDATWQYAKEMVHGCPILARMQHVVLPASAGRKPQFLVRKPERIISPSTSSAGEEAQGFSTAEAVAMFLDEFLSRMQMHKPSFRPITNGGVHIPESALRKDVPASKAEELLSVRHSDQNSDDDARYGETGGFADDSNGIVKDLERCNETSEKKDDGATVMQNNHPVAETSGRDHNRGSALENVCYNAVIAPLQAYVRYQFAHMASGVKHRIDRPKYDPTMLEGLDALSRMRDDPPRTESDQKKRKL